MLALKLYVATEEGVLQQVDLFADESISLTQSIQDVRDIEKIFTDFTKTFSVPASRINNKVFKHFHNYNIVGFDARIKRDAELYLNDELFRKGKIKLEGATTKNNKAHTYKITFFGSTINLKDILGEDKLDALSFLNNFTFNYTDANIKTYMNNGLDVTIDNVVYEDALLFPLISHTKRLTYDSTSGSGQIKNTDKINNIFFSSSVSDLGLEISQLKPALRVDVIIRAIENNYPITFTDDFFSAGNIPYYNLYLWLHHKTGGLFVDDESSSVFGNFIIGNPDDDNVITLNRGNFLVPQRGGNMKNERQLDITITPTQLSATFTITIKKDGIVFKEFKDQQVNASNGTEWKEKDIVLERGTYTIEVQCSAAITFGFEGFVKRLRKFATPKIYWTGSATTIVGNNINAATKLPEIKVIDFLTGLFKVFNLTAFQNKDGDIEVKTLDNFYGSSNKVWDITKDIDKTEQTVNSVLPFKQIDFKYKGTKTFLAANYNERFHKEWGRANETPTDKVDGQVYTVENPFEHMMFERLPDEKTSVTTKTDIQYGWSADISQGAYLGEPLLFYPILQTGITFGLIDSAGNVSNRTSTYIPSNSFLLTDSVNINYAAEINEFNQTVQFNKTLFDQYYKKYITEVFDKGRRLTTTKAYLPLNVTKNMTLADKFRISDRLYKINKIVTNFENNLSTLELINTRTNLGDTIIVDTRIKQKYDNVLKCIRVDSNQINADSIIETSDMACGDVGDGKIIDNPSDNISSDILDPNLPVSGNSSGAIIVSPPTIAKIGDNIVHGTLTNYTINPTWSINELGKIDQTKNIDEYGFIFSTNKFSLLGTDLVAIKSNVNTTVVEYPQTAFTNKPTTPHLVKVTDYAINYGTINYYIFYARTNTNIIYDFADAISDIQVVNATTYCNGDFYSNVYFESFDEPVNFTAQDQTGKPFTVFIQPNKSTGIGIPICLDSITSSGPIKINMDKAIKV